MGECADADHVDAQRAEGSHAFERDSTGHFHDGPAVDERERVAHLVVVEVVEHDDVGSGHDRFFELGSSVDFAFDAAGVWRVCARALDRLGASTRRSDVVVFDQHGGAQVLAVIVAATAANRIALEGAQPRRRLASIGDPRRRTIGQSVDKLPRHGRNPGEPLQKIERDTLAKENRRCWPGKRRQGGACLDEVAILHMGIDIHQEVDLREHLFEDRQPAHDHGLARV